MKDGARADLVQPFELDPSSRLFELSNLLTKQPPSSHFSVLAVVLSAEREDICVAAAVTDGITACVVCAYWFHGNPMYMLHMIGSSCKFMQVKAWDDTAGHIGNRLLQLRVDPKKPTVILQHVLCSGYSLLKDTVRCMLCEQMVLTHGDAGRGKTP